jgi:SAM-dependent methyltransferase
MLYRARLYGFKWAGWLVSKCRTVVRQPSAQRYSPIQAAPNLENDVRGVQIRKHVPGKSFLDVGCMYGIHGAFTFLAEQYGATRSVGLDALAATSEFEEYRESRHSAVEFFQGDIFDRNLDERIGKPDVVFCSGVLYHAPDPFLLLVRLRELCGETLLLSSRTIPEMEGLQNTAVFYPYLSDGQREVWNQHRGRAIGLTEPFDPEQGYANWFWGLSSSCIASMLQCAGFKVESVIGRQPLANLRPSAHLFVCHVDTAKTPTVWWQPPLRAVDSAAITTAVPGGRAQ